MEKVFIKPTEDDLMIAGELLSIEIKYTSFYVRTQLASVNMLASTFVVDVAIYPLIYLPHFFAANAKNPLITNRPDCYPWAQQFKK